MDESSKKTVVDDLRNSLYHLSNQELVVALGQYPDEADRLRECLRLADGPTLNPAQSKIYAELCQKLLKTRQYNADRQAQGQLGGETRVVLTSAELDVLLALLEAP